MRTLSSYIIFFIASCLFFVSCKEDYLEWSPTMWDTTKHPFDAGRFINMCYYNQDPSIENYRYVHECKSINLYASEYRILESSNVAFISSDTLYVRSRYLNCRIQDGNRTFIAAQTIVPVFGGEIVVNNGENAEPAEVNPVVISGVEVMEYDGCSDEAFDEDEVSDDEENRCEEYSDDPSSEYVGKPLTTIEGNRFNLNTFFSQAKNQNFPLSDVSIFPVNDNIPMPSFLCSRYLTNTDILNELGIDYLPADIKVLLSVDGQPVVVRYMFDNGALLTVLVNPLLLSNFSISYENAQFAHVAMNLMRYAFSAEKTDKLPWIPFYLEQTRLEKEQLYAADKDPTKKGGRPFTPSYENDSSGEWNSILELLETLWPFLLVFLPLIFIQRQRVIPIFEGYKNRSAEYAKHVGMMYAKEGNIHQILLNRISYFYYDVKRKYGVDLSDSERIPDSASILASHWSVNEDEVQSFLSRLDAIRTSSVEDIVSESYLANVCEQMNKYSNL